MGSKAVVVSLCFRWLLDGSSCTYVAEQLVEGGSGSGIAVVLCREVFADRECVVRQIIFMGECSRV